MPGWSRWRRSPPPSAAWCGSSPGTRDRCASTGWASRPHRPRPSVRPVDLGMTLPVMEPDLWESDATLEQWARAIDEGPFASLCFGERIAFDNPETLVLLGA